MKIRYWAVVLAVLVLLPSASEAQLRISEVVEGTASNLKYVEIYNSGASAVDLGTAAVQLRRYTNGATTFTSIPLTGSIGADDFFVVANNQTDFRNAFGSTSDADLYASNVSHNGDDSYALSVGGIVVDGFGLDWATGTDPGNPAADGAFHRVASALPNSGDWGGTGSVADGQPSPSGYWIKRAMTSANGNAATICTPGAAGGSSNSELPVELETFEVK